MFTSNFSTVLEKNNQISTNIHNLSCDFTDPIILNFLPTENYAGVERASSANPFFRLKPLEIISWTELLDRASYQHIE